MLAVENVDFIQQQIKQEEWQEEEVVAKINATDDAKRSIIDLNTRTCAF